MGLRAPRGPPWVPHRRHLAGQVSVVLHPGGLRAVLCGSGRAGEGADLASCGTAQYGETDVGRPEVRHRHPGAAAGLLGCWVLRMLPDGQKYEGPGAVVRRRGVCHVRVRAGGTPVAIRSRRHLPTRLGGAGQIEYIDGTFTKLPRCGTLRSPPVLDFQGEVAGCLSLRLSYGRYQWGRASSPRPNSGSGRDVIFK